MDYVRAMIAEISGSEDETVLRAEGATVLRGHLLFTSDHVAEISSNTVRFHKAIIATGSSPILPPIPGLLEVEPLTNETIFDLRDPLESLAIIGGGPIGCELAQAISTLGIRVMLIESTDRLLSREEPEVSDVILSVLSRAGVTVLLNAEVKEVRREHNGDVVTTLSHSSASDAPMSLSTTRVLVATGRSPRTAGLGLELAGVHLNTQGFISTNDFLRTNRPNIFAAGDVTGRMMFTHAGDEMGRIAAHNAFSSDLRFKRYRSRATPWATYTSPEVARVGLSEDQAAQRGGRVAFLPLDAIDRSLLSGETQGFIKIITGPLGPLGYLGGGQVIGATIVAPHAGEMIHELALAVQTKMFVGRLAQTVHAYPTVSLGIRSAAAQFFYTEGGRRSRPARPNP
jgi:pyruvate/2-oxoglutarate dehydrogenase complex dihydrolipoamide dehydrogenase (E3) component